MAKRSAGRPKSCININLNDVQNTVEVVRDFLSQENDVYVEQKRRKVKCLIGELQKLVIDSDEKQVQTDVTSVHQDTQTKLNSEDVLHFLLQFNDEDKAYIISQGFKSFDDDQNKLVILFDSINKLNHELQCNLYTLLGNSFHHILLEYTQKHHMNLKQMTIQDLSRISKGEIYNSFDDRLQCFFDAATSKSSTDRIRESHDNLNEKANIVESLLKARNFKCVTASGMSENIICHFASNKSKDTGQVLSKVGAKGCKKSLDIVLNNSLIKSVTKIHFY